MMDINAQRFVFEMGFLDVIGNLSQQYTTSQLIAVHFISGCPCSFDQTANESTACFHFSGRETLLLPRLGES